MASGEMFCGQCGSPAITPGISPAAVTRSSTSCINGHPIEPGQAYCDECGAGLAPFLPVAGGATETQGHSRRRMALIGLASIAIVGAVVGIAFGAEGHPGSRQATKTKTNKATDPCANSASNACYESILPASSSKDTLPPSAPTRTTTTTGVPTGQSIGSESSSSGSSTISRSTGLPESEPTTAHCISGVPTSTANVTNTPGTGGQNLVDVSGVVTNNSTSPVYVSFIYYSVEYGKGPTGSTEQSPEIDETVPVGGSVAWDSGSSTSSVMATGASARVIYSFTNSEASC